MNAKHRKILFQELIHSSMLIIIHPNPFIQMILNAKSFGPRRGKFPRHGK